MLFRSPRWIDGEMFSDWAWKEVDHALTYPQGMLLDGCGGVVSRGECLLPVLLACREFCTALYHPIKGAAGTPLVP